VRLEVAFDQKEVIKLLPDVTEIFDVASRGQPRLHFLAGAQRLFTIDMLERAAEQSRLALFVLYLGDTPVSTSFTFRRGGLMGGGGLRFDPAFGKFSPGQLLFRRILEYAFANGCSVFDFAPRDAPYKREWSTGAYDTVEISAFSSEFVHTLRIALTMSRSFASYAKMRLGRRR
jgi:CelD/BcsL family acetyltransferase involved in cellulose biosynthesis